MRSRWLAAACTVLASACELAEVTTVPVEDVLVVESVLEAGRFRQAVLLHRSVAGGEVPGERGARVWLDTPTEGERLYLEGPLSACAEGVRLETTDSLVVDATCYVTPLAVRIRPGATYELHVLTGSGERVRGRTTVPEAFELYGPTLPGTTCALRPGTNLPLAWSVSKGAWSYLAFMEVIGLGTALRDTGIPAPDRMQLTGLAISESDTTLVIPSQLGVFELRELSRELIEYLQNGFPAGVSVRIAISAVERNYVNAIRGGRFNPSGAVRISSVIGDGTGVFGSMLTRTLNVEVTSASRLPSCLPDPERVSAAR